MSVQEAGQHTTGSYSHIHARDHYKDSRMSSCIYDAQSEVFKQQYSIDTVIIITLDISFFTRYNNDSALQAATLYHRLYSSLIYLSTTTSFESINE